MQRKYLFLNNGPETSADGLKQELREACESVISTPPVCTALTRYYNDEHSVGKTQSQISNNIKRKTLGAQFTSLSPWGFLSKVSHWVCGKDEVPLRSTLKPLEGSTGAVQLTLGAPVPFRGVCLCLYRWLKILSAGMPCYEQAIEKHPTEWLHLSSLSFRLSWHLSGRLMQVAMDGCTAA